MLTSVRRTTLETDIVASVGSGFSVNLLRLANAGIEVLDRLIAQYAFYSNLDVKLCCVGDSWLADITLLEDVEGSGGALSCEGVLLSGVFKVFACCSVCGRCSD